MCLHYTCFLLFLLASLTFFVADLIDPPPQGVQIHVATEVIKLISSVLLQFSLGVVILSLIKGAVA